MITTNNLVKKFGDIKAIDSVNLQVNKGSIYGLVGPNGSGKTTLIKTLVGVYKPFSGNVTIDGVDVYDNNVIKKRMVYIPDDLYFPTGARLKDMAIFYSKMYPNFDWERFEKITSSLGLDIKKRLFTFSKGMKKQAEFSLCVAAKAEVMILDEPIDGLDPLIRKQIWSLLLQDVAARDLTVLVSSHNLRELEGICNYIGILNKGKLIGQKHIEDYETLLLEEIFIQEMGGDGYEFNKITL